MDSVTVNIGRYIKKRGMSLAAISRATGIPYFSLYNSLSSEKRKRKLRIEEAIKLCQFLEKDPRDFAVTNDQDAS